MKKAKAIDLIPTRVVVVSLEEFVEIYEKRRGDIQSARIVPPKLGRNDFGKIVVEWKNLVFTLPDFAKAS